MVDIYYMILYSVSYGVMKNDFFLVGGEEIARVIIRPSGDREANLRLLDGEQTGTIFFNSLSARILYYIITYYY